MNEEDNYGFNDVTSKELHDEGNERWVRFIDDHCWISALLRIRGGDYIHRWETALVVRYPEGTMPRPKRYDSDDRDIWILNGDRRKETAGMNKEQLITFFKEQE